MNAESLKKIRAFVSNAGKQYTHQLLYALQKANIDYNFFTSFWYKPAAFPFTLIKWLPYRFAKAAEKQLGKRYFDKIPEGKVAQFPWFELIREFLDKIVQPKVAEYLLYYRDRIHDTWASSKVSRKYDLVIGYEECSLKTFRKARELGITCVLDLAQIHYSEIENISRRSPAFSELYKNRKLRKKINAIKQEELLLADYIICLSGFAKDTLLKNGYLAERIFTVSLGFDPLKFLPKKEYIHGEKLKIVYAGTITKRKGIDMLLRLKEELKNEVHLTFIGPMADGQDLFEQHAGNFTWHSYLSQEEMNRIFNEQDVFVFPSYLDSWAMGVIERCGG
jgi:glycosyltransferase involved in cell wall biosynthesis